MNFLTKKLGKLLKHTLISLFAIGYTVFERNVSLYLPVPDLFAHYSN